MQINRSLSLSLKGLFSLSFFFFLGVKAEILGLFHQKKIAYGYFLKRLTFTQYVCPMYDRDI